MEMPSSHPVRVRGLKHKRSATSVIGVLSHPVRVRGLKAGEKKRGPKPSRITAYACLH